MRNHGPEKLPVWTHFTYCDRILITLLSKAKPSRSALSKICLEDLQENTHAEV